jgi:hypothetical protein
MTLSSSSIDSVQSNQTIHSRGSELSVRTSQPPANKDLGSSVDVYLYHPSHRIPRRYLIIDAGMYRIIILFPERHALQLVEQSPPVVSQHLRVLDAFLGPVLVPAADVVLRLLEEDELVADALTDEHGTVVLVYDAFLILWVR